MGTKRHLEQICRCERRGNHFLLPNQHTHGAYHNVVRMLLCLSTVEVGNTKVLSRLIVNVFLKPTNFEFLTAWASHVSMENLQIQLKVEDHHSVFGIPCKPIMQRELKRDSDNITYKFVIGVIFGILKKSVTTNMYKLLFLEYYYVF